MQHYRHFKVIVAGENPEELMLRHDSNIKVEPYVVFEFSKAEEYKKNYLKSLRSILKHAEKESIDKAQIQYLKDEINEVETESPTDYFLDLTEGFVLDEKTGNAMSTENPDGKFTSHKVGGDFSTPFILKKENDDDVPPSETYSARKGDIDWEKIHLANQRPYEIAWDTTHGLAEPKDDEELAIYNNMKNLKAYFLNFEGREHYIASNTAFWGFAFVDESGWHDILPGDKQFEWVIGFYDRFIKPLPDDTLLTIYECVRPES
jgi:hypothetical protein